MKTILTIAGLVMVFGLVGTPDYVTDVERENTLLRSQLTQAQAACIEQPQIAQAQRAAIPKPSGVQMKSRPSSVILPMLAAPSLWPKSI